MITLATIGFLTTTIGEVIIGYSVIRVHGKVEHEHKIDKEVIREIDKERRITMAGLLFIILGAIMQLIGLDLILF